MSISDLDKGLQEELTCRVDPSTCDLEDLVAEVNRYKNIREFYSGREQAIKTFLNSVYGATANKWFECYNIDISESITLQAQELNGYASICIDRYFSGVFQEDFELHKKLGIDSNLAQKIKLESMVAPHQNLGYPTLTVYGDTDSSYVTFDPIIKALNIPQENQAKFIVELNQFALQDYLESEFEKYAKLFNCDHNLQGLELEKVASNLFLYAKKRYIMELSWKEPNIYIEPLHDISIRGIEVVQKSTPIYAREVQKDFIHYIIEQSHKGTISAAGCINKLKKYRQEIELQPIDNIVKNFKLNNYEKYVISDKNEIVFGENATQQAKAAATYNHILNRYPKYKSKYKPIVSGQQVKFYPTTRTKTGVFGFLPGEFPGEFAPEIDYNETFEKNIFDPLNRLMNLVGINNVPHTLVSSTTLF